MSDAPSLGGYSMREWRTILHKAAQAAQADPTDQEAVEWRERALRHISALNTGQNVADVNALDAPHHPLVTVGADLLHGAGLGTGEVFSGLGSTATGGSFREGAQTYRESLADLEQGNPASAAFGSALSAVALPGATVGSEVAKGVKAGVPLGVRGALRLLRSGATVGGTTGAVQGFSSGGEDPGDLGARVRSGVTTGAKGAIAGTVAAGLAARAARPRVEAAADIADKGVARANRLLQQDRLKAATGREAILTENAQIRNALLKRRQARTEPQARPVGNAVDDIGQAQEDFAAGKISEEDLNTAMAVAGHQMQGSTVPETPMAPSPKPAPDPLDVPTYARRPGTISAALPRRGVGGHSYTGTYPKGTIRGALPERPTPSPKGGPSGDPMARQLAHLQELLAQAPTRAAKVDILRNARSLGALSDLQVQDLIASIP